MEDCQVTRSGRMCVILPQFLYVHPHIDPPSCRLWAESSALSDPSTNPDMTRKGIAEVADTRRPSAEGWRVQEPGTRRRRIRDREKRIERKVCEGRLRV